MDDETQPEPVEQTEPEPEAKKPGYNYETGEVI